MTRPACPPIEQIQAFAAGRLGSEQIDSIAEHVEGCPSCESELHRLSELERGNPGFESGLAGSLSPEDRLILDEVKRRVSEQFDEDHDASPVMPNIPGFEIDGAIGSGGQATVFLARQTNLGGRRVAIKILGYSPGMVVREQWARFQLEGQALGLLDHPNIVKVYQSGRAEKLFYLVLEYIDGGTLKDRLNGRPSPIRDAAELVETVARAAHYAHEQGVIHRDLKPGNILLTPGLGIPKVTDFGLARLVDRDSDLSRADSPLGTLEYMSPEQCVGRGKLIGPGTDVYSLGVILFEMLTGRLPFESETSEGDDRVGLIRQICETEPVSPKLLRPQIPRNLDTICRKSLEKDPARRYRSAGDLADDLKRLLDGKPIHGRPVGVLEKVWRWGRRNPIPAVACLVVIASLVGVGSSEFRRVTSELKNQKTVIRQEAAALTASLHAEARKWIQRGNWAEAREKLLKARRLPDSNLGEIDLELAEVYAQMSNAEDALRSLKQARAILGDDVRVMLLEADLLAATAPEASRLAAQRALATGKLDGADTTFARALVAPDLLSAVDSLRQTLVARPYHAQARRMLVGLLLLIGRLDEAKDVANRGRDFAPEDNTDLLVGAVSEAIRGRRKEAIEVLDRAGGRLDRTTRASFETTIHYLSSLPQIGANQQIPSNVSVAEMIASIVKFLLGSREIANLSLPPGLRQAYGELAGGLFSFRSDSLTRSTRILGTHRDGLTLYIHGCSLIQKGDFARAESVFLEAAMTPSLIDMSRPSRSLAVRSGFQVWRFGGLPEPDRASYRVRLVESLPVILSEPEIDVSSLFEFGEMAWQIADHRSLRIAAEKWQKVRPNDLGPELFLAYLDLGENYPVGAMEHAARAYARRKQGTDVFKANEIDPEGQIRAVFRRAAALLRTSTMKILHLSLIPTGTDLSSSMSEPDRSPNWRMIGTTFPESSTRKAMRTIG